MFLCFIYIYLVIKIFVYNIVINKNNKIILSNKKILLKFFKIYECKYFFMFWYFCFYFDKIVNDLKCSLLKGMFMYKEGISMYFVFVYEWF